MIGNIESYLMLPRPGTRDEQFFANFVSGLTRDQGKAICSFLRFLADEYVDDYSPGIAIKYWENFGER